MVSIKTLFHPGKLYIGYISISFPENSTTSFDIFERNAKQNDMLFKKSKSNNDYPTLSSDVFSIETPKWNQPIELIGLESNSSSNQNVNNEPKFGESPIFPNKANFSDLYRSKFCQFPQKNLQEQSLRNESYSSPILNRRIPLIRPEKSRDDFLEKFEQNINLIKAGKEQELGSEFCSSFSGGNRNHLRLVPRENLGQSHGNIFQRETLRKNTLSRDENLCPNLPNSGSIKTPKEPEEFLGVEKTFNKENSDINLENNMVKNPDTKRKYLDVQEENQFDTSSLIDDVMFFNKLRSNPEKTSTPKPAYFKHNDSDMDITSNVSTLNISQSKHQQQQYPSSPVVVVKNAQIMEGSSESSPFVISLKQHPEPKSTNTKDTSDILPKRTSSRDSKIGVKNASLQTRSSSSNYFMPTKKQISKMETLFVAQRNKDRKIVMKKFTNSRFKRKTKTAKILEITNRLVKESSSSGSKQIVELSSVSETTYTTKQSVTLKQS